MGPLKDRINNVQHLLYLSGASTFSYWSSYVVIDFIKYGIITILLTVFLGFINTSFLYFIQDQSPRCQNVVRFAEPISGRYDNRVTTPICKFDAFGRIF